jgi:hypothetical protein
MTIATSAGSQPRGRNAAGRMQPAVTSVGHPTGGAIFLWDSLGAFHNYCRRCDLHRSTEPAPGMLCPNCGMPMEEVA